jgi:hypothetical protein
MQNLTAIVPMQHSASSACRKLQKQEAAMTCRLCKTSIFVWVFCSVMCGVPLSAIAQVDALSSETEHEVSTITLPQTPREKGASGVYSSCVYDSYRYVLNDIQDSLIVQELGTCYENRPEFRSPVSTSSVAPCFLNSMLDDCTSYSPDSHNKIDTVLLINDQGVAENSQGRRFMSWTNPQKAKLILDKIRMNGGFISNEMCMARIDGFVKSFKKGDDLPVKLDPQIMLTSCMPVFHRICLDENSRTAAFKKWSDEANAVSQNLTYDLQAWNKFCSAFNSK